MEQKFTKKIKDSLTHTHTLPEHCVDDGRQEKAGLPDSAVMELYSRISLFVLVGPVKVRSSSRGQTGSRHQQPVTHTLLPDHTHINTDSLTLLLLMLSANISQWIKGNTIKFM